jgi:ATP-dependent DNA ligase
MFEAHAEKDKKLAREYRKSRDDVDTAQSAWVKPMLAHKYEGWSGPCFSQPKLDGVRCIATSSGLFSREGKPIYGVPHIQEELETFFSTHDKVLDGELYNHDLHDDFNAIVSVVKKQNPTAAQVALSAQLVHYHVYDMPDDTMTFGQRTAWLRNFLPTKRAVVLVDTDYHPDEDSLNRATGTGLDAPSVRSWRSLTAASSAQVSVGPKARCGPC